MIRVAAGLALAAGGCGGGSGPATEPGPPDFAAGEHHTGFVEAMPKPKIGNVELLAEARSLDAAERIVRYAAVERLADLAEHGDLRAEALRGLESALVYGDAEIRAAAISALAEVGGDGAAETLSIALWSDDPEVREEAIDALADIGGPVSIGLLQRSLSDDDSDVRELAAEYLAELAP